MSEQYKPPRKIGGDAMVEGWCEGQASANWVWRRRRRRGRKEEGKGGEGRLTNQK